MNQLSESIADYIIRYDSMNSTSREMLTYRLHSLCGMVVFSGVLLLTSGLLGWFPQACTFLAFFFSLRCCTGGFHLQSEAGCFVCSLVIALGCIGLASVLPKSALPYGVCILATLVAATAILVLSPVNHPNVHLSQREMKILKKRVAAVMLTQVALIVCMLFLSVPPPYFYTAGAAVILDAVLVSVAKLVKQEA